MFGASSELAPNMFGASSELASVMEFGFNPSELLTVAQYTRTGDDLPACESFGLSPILEHILVEAVECTNLRKNVKNTSRPVLLKSYWKASTIVLSSTVSIKRNPFCRLLCDAMPARYAMALCPSFCPSVTSRSSTKMSKRRIT